MLSSNITWPPPSGWWKIRLLFSKFQLIPKFCRNILSWPTDSESNLSWGTKKACMLQLPSCASMWCCVVLCCAVVPDSVTPWTVACQAPLSMDFPGKDPGVGCHLLLQGNMSWVVINPEKINTWTRSRYSSQISTEPSWPTDMQIRSKCLLLSVKEILWMFVMQQQLTITCAHDRTALPGLYGCWAGWGYMTSSGRQTCDLCHFQARAFIASKRPSRVLSLSDTEANNIPHSGCSISLHSWVRRHEAGPQPKKNHREYTRWVKTKSWMSLTSET